MAKQAAFHTYCACSKDVVVAIVRPSANPVHLFYQVGIDLDELYSSPTPPSSTSAFGLSRTHVSESGELPLPPLLLRQVARCDLVPEHGSRNWKKYVLNHALRCLAVFLDCCDESDVFIDVEFCLSRGGVYISRDIYDVMSIVASDDIPQTNNPNNPSLADWADANTVYFSLGRSPTFLADELRARLPIVANEVVVMLSPNILIEAFAGRPAVRHVSVRSAAGLTNVLVQHGREVRQTDRLVIALRSSEAPSATVAIDVDGYLMRVRPVADDWLSRMTWTMVASARSSPDLTRMNISSLDTAIPETRKGVRSGSDAAIINGLGQSLGQAVHIVSQG